MSTVIDIIVIIIIVVISRPY